MTAQTFGGNIESLSKRLSDEAEARTNGREAKLLKLVRGRGLEVDELSAELRRNLWFAIHIIGTPERDRSEEQQAYVAVLTELLKQE